VIGSAYVAGLESSGIVATLKHFVGYSASRAGRNQAPVSMGPREPADVMPPPDRPAAVVCGFFPGEEGATALADVLSGRENPTGRLPIHFPRRGANQPSTYLTPTLGRLSEGSVVDPTPVFPFGHGLSYASATWDAAEIEAGPQWQTDGTCAIVVCLVNDTAVPTSEVVQVYLHGPMADMVRPLQRLIAAPRVDLPPGTAKTVHITLDADLTSFTGGAGRRIVTPAAVQLRVGAPSADIRATLDLVLVGPRREVGADRVLDPEAVVPDS
jgi:beta-xylosidase